MSEPSPEQLAALKKAWPHAEVVARDLLEKAVHRTHGRLDLVDTLSIAYLWGAQDAAEAAAVLGFFNPAIDQGP